MTSIKLLTRLVLVASALSASLGGAQTRNHFALEATPFHGTLSYARGVPSEARVGFEAGFGFPQADVTLAPNRHNFTQIAHVGVFGRFAPSPSVQVDLGVRGGFADVTGLGADDFPDPYAALSSAVLLGKGRLKFGARVSAGYSWPFGDPTTFVAGISPIVSYTLSW